MKIKILRQRSPFSEPYWESFRYDGPADNTIAGVIDYLNCNDDIVNEQGELTDRINWECSCMQAMCGGCAMVINGKPALACETFLRDISGEEIIVRPLSKFPVVSDLVVDRSQIFDGLKKSGIYIGQYDLREEDHDHQYTLAKCLKCGLCLEICPNYGRGKEFYGAAFANDCYYVYARDRDRGAEMKKEYAEHFAGTCSRSLSCMDICPVKIPTLASIAKMNRSVK